MRNRFSTLKVVFGSLGSLLIVLAGFLGLPFLIVIYNGAFKENISLLLAFGVPIVISLILGLILRKLYRPDTLNSTQAMLIFALGWLGFSAIEALTQWIGGLGILTFFLAISVRGVGAHWLFGAESHKIDLGRPVPGLANTLAILWGIYSAFTIVILLGLYISGMSLFDSVCKSFTALSTGGFSPHDASIEYYLLSGFKYYIWI
ncbi:MAG TPA: TrkH family potassium uptake protein [Candidatus Marinimicrobia bacterium]|nr:TrkH family potassium uptake protein [Candidatus Neomarinimicrobiota bacterium]